MQEAKELASESTYEYSAHPLEVGCYENRCHICHFSANPNEN